VFTFAVPIFVRTVSQVPRASEHLGLDDLKVVGLKCDVSLEESVADAFARTIGAFGRVDAVVASAGKFGLSS
jgi:NAD(P)-dependent dehydrogenase (short-subunit alcohol dehydrogenase family)